MRGRESLDELPAWALKRAAALTALADAPLTRRELEDEIDISRTTSHRIVRGLEERDLLDRGGNDLVLTPLGRAIAREVGRYQSNVTAAVRLEPFLTAVEHTDVDVPVEYFADATVTIAGQGTPYRPVRRFMELLRDTDTLRGFDTTTIAPMYVDEIRAEILGGMTTDVIYLPPVANQIVDEYPGKVAAATEAGNLTLHVADELPFGLAIYDDRVGIGGYDDDTGMLVAFADTDDADARTWALEQYETYRERATPLSEWHDDW